MRTTPDNPVPEGSGFNRRHLIVGGAAGAGVGALGAAGTSNQAGPSGRSTVPFYGARQAGVDTTAPGAHAVFLGLLLNSGASKDSLARMLQLLTDDAAKLASGTGALADTEPELAYFPANLTVTLGFGPRIFELLDAPGPDWLAPLPSYRIDQLRPEYGQSDLVLQICGDEPISVAHAARMLSKDARSFASVHWSQRGFRRAANSAKPKTTMRNLFGQLDGTSNPEPGGEEFERVVYGAGEGYAPWAEQGTSLVIRRIAMNLDKWDELDPAGRSESVGRRISNGAPLTGTAETDEPDFEAKNPVGFPVIADFAHIRRARPEDPRVRIFRRAYNYDDAPDAGHISNSGLIFASYQSDVSKQFEPIQSALAELDLLNEWTTPIGSAVYAIPPGVSEGEFLGQFLF